MIIVRSQKAATNQQSVLCYCLTVVASRFDHRTPILRQESIIPEKISTIIFERRAIIQQFKIINDLFGQLAIFFVENI